jgi:hypothetical protein
MRSSNTKSNSSFNRFERFKNFKRLKFYLSFLRNIDRRLIQAVEGIRKFFNWIIQNILALATIVTAIAAIITIHLTTLKPAEIEMQAGSFIAIAPGCECDEIDKSRYSLKIPVSFYNDGARPGILARVGLLIKDNNTWAYFFKSNYDEVLKDEKGKRVWQLNSAFSPIIVPPRNAISRNLRFETSGFVFSPNRTYDFWILVWDKESINPTFRKKFKFSFESSRIEFVEEIRKKQIKSAEEIRKKQKISASQDTINSGNQDGNTVTFDENGKYGPITGAIDDRTYKSLTGSGQSLFHLLIGEDE